MIYTLSFTILLKMYNKLGNYMNIINIYKRPSGKTGWKIENNNYTYSNKKLLEVLKNNILLKNNCLIQFQNIGECGAMGLDPDSIRVIKNKLFNLNEACEFIQARIDEKKVEVEIKLKFF